MFKVVTLNHGFFTGISRSITVDTGPPISVNRTRELTMVLDRGPAIGGVGF
jgi:hypothetical protein